MGVFELSDLDLESAVRRGEVLVGSSYIRKNADGTYTLIDLYSGKQKVFRSLDELEDYLSVLYPDGKIYVKLSDEAGKDVWRQISERLRKSVPLLDLDETSILRHLSDMSIGDVVKFKNPAGVDVVATRTEKGFNVIVGSSEFTVATPEDVMKLFSLDFSDVKGVLKSLDVGNELKLFTNGGKTVIFRRTAEGYEALLEGKVYKASDVDELLSLLETSKKGLMFYLNYPIYKLWGEAVTPLDVLAAATPAVFATITGEWDVQTTSQLVYEVVENFVIEPIAIKAVAAGIKWALGVEAAPATLGATALVVAVEVTAEEIATSWVNLNTRLYFGDPIVSANDFERFQQAIGEAWNRFLNWITYTENEKITSFSPTLTAYIHQLAMENELSRLNATSMLVPAYVNPFACLTNLFECINNGWMVEVKADDVVGGGAYILEGEIANSVDWKEVLLTVIECNSARCALKEAIRTAKSLEEREVFQKYEFSFSPAVLLKAAIEEIDAAVKALGEREEVEREEMVAYHAYVDPCLKNQLITHLCTLGKEVLANKKEMLNEALEMLKGLDLRNKMKFVQTKDGKTLLCIASSLDLEVKGDGTELSEYHSSETSGISCSDSCKESCYDVTGVRRVSITLDGLEIFSFSLDLPSCDNCSVDEICGYVSFAGRLQQTCVKCDSSTVGSAVINENGDFLVCSSMGGETKWRKCSEIQKGSYTALSPNGKVYCIDGKVLSSCSSSTECDGICVNYGPLGSLCFSCGSSDRLVKSIEGELYACYGESLIKLKPCSSTSSCGSDEICAIVEGGGYCLPPLRLEKSIRVKDVEGNVWELGFGEFKPVLKLCESSQDCGAGEICILYGNGKNYCTSNECSESGAIVPGVLSSSTEKFYVCTWNPGLKKYTYAKCGASGTIGKTVLYGGTIYECVASGWKVVEGSCEDNSDCRPNEICAFGEKKIEGKTYNVKVCLGCTSELENQTYGYWKCESGEWKLSSKCCCADFGANCTMVSAIEECPSYASLEVASDYCNKILCKGMCLDWVPVGCGAKGKKVSCLPEEKLWRRTCSKKDCTIYVEEKCEFSSECISTTTTTLPGNATTTTTTLPGNVTTTTTVVDCYSYGTCSECVAAGCEWCQIDSTCHPAGYCQYECSDYMECYYICPSPTTTTLSCNNYLSCSSCVAAGCYWCSAGNCVADCESCESRGYTCYSSCPECYNHSDCASWEYCNPYNQCECRDEACDNYCRQAGYTEGECFESEATSVCFGEAGDYCCCWP